MNLAKFRAMGSAFALVLLGALAHAVVGTPPGTGPALTDGAWLTGLAGGQNFLYQSGITAHAGGTQAAAFQLPVGISLMEVDTVATTSDSVMLPQCIAGMNFSVANAGANTLNVFGQVTVNPVTGVADTINGTAGSSAYTLSTNTNAEFFCAKSGSWKAVKGS